MIVDVFEKEIYVFESNIFGSSMEIYKIGVDGVEFWKDVVKVKG